MAEILNRREAQAFSGLDEKMFNNFFMTAQEIKCLERTNGRGFYKFDKDELQKWKESFVWRSGKLDINDYIRCLDFALAMHYRAYVTSDFGTGRQREFGQKVSNWMKGQLGELALKKFLHEKFGLDIDLDFEIREDIVAQDVIAVHENGSAREPKVGIGIKTSKSKSCFLVLSEGDLREGRRSDVYVFCRVDIPDDHLLRITKDAVIELVKGQQHYDRYKAEIPGFEDISYEIAGWCEQSDLQEVTSIPGQDFTGTRFVIASGLMRRDETSWRELISRL